MPITAEQVSEAERLQHQAAHDPNPKVRLIAGPGSGKSYAIGERVRWLLEQKVPPERIRPLSFTRAASESLREKVYKYCSDRSQSGYELVSISTLHSLALKSLRLAGLLPFPVDPLVLDNIEVEIILDAEYSYVSGLPISRSKLIRADFEAFCGTGQYEPINHIPPDPPITEAERDRFRAFHTPRTHLYACVLPGDIVRQCVDHMVAGSLDPAEIMSIEHLILDEFQDFNPADLEFVNWLVERGVTTFVAGDDDQSIYSFRYASPEGIQAFVAEKGQLGDHELVHCFRCTPRVLSSGQALITASAHPARIPKDLTSLYDNSDPAVEGICIYWRLPSAVREAREIAHSCAALIQAGVPPSEIMILLSYTQLQLQDLQPELENAGVLFEMPREQEYSDSLPGRFAFSIIRITCDPDDFVAHRLILGLLPGVGPGTCNAIALAAIDAPSTYRDIFRGELNEDRFSGRARTALTRARQVVSEISSWSPTDSISDRIDDIGQILEEHFGNDSRIEWENEIDALPAEMNIEELRAFFWADNDDRRSRVLETVYERVGLELPEQGFHQDKVRILTMHGAKGLDAQVVFIPGLEEELLPGPRRQQYTGLVLEAARMLYVSITRAKAACILSFAGTRLHHGKFTRTTPSRFVPQLGGYFVYKGNEEVGLSNQQMEEITVSIQNL